MSDEIIAERIAALGARSGIARNRTSRSENAFEARDPDSDPEPDH